MTMAKSLQPDLLALVRDPIDPSALIQHVREAEDGAVVTFDGCVRNHSHGRRTLYLDYESYESMALAKIREIAEQMHEKFPIHLVAIAHRLGRLEIGETSVFIAVSSAHRPAAFDACRFAIDTLKRSCRSGRRSISRMAPSGRMARCPPHLWRHERRNLHLSKKMNSLVDEFRESMIPTPIRAFAAAIAFLAATPGGGERAGPGQAGPPAVGAAETQAQAVTQFSSADAVAPEPPAMPSPEPPASIVPTPEQPLRPSGDADVQRAESKVKVELVNILASVLDDHNRPASDLPVEAFQVFEEGVAQKIEVFESETHAATRPCTDDRLELECEQRNRV